MKSLAMIFLICGFSGAVLVTIAIAILSRIGVQEIRRQGKLDKGSELKLEAVNLSSSYYIYVTYGVSSDTEIHRAYWRLKGNEVVVEK